jgi:hypothetical protein
MVRSDIRLLPKTRSTSLDFRGEEVTAFERAAESYFRRTGVSTETTPLPTLKELERQ